jgi:pyrroloquinoline quinone (PQQ) biosynthesis protein C
MRTLAERQIGSTLASELEIALERLATGLQLPAGATTQARATALRLVEGLESNDSGRAGDGLASCGGCGLSVTFAGDQPQIELSWDVASLAQLDRVEPVLRELFGSSLARVRHILPLFFKDGTPPGFLSLAVKIWPPRAAEPIARFNPQVFDRLQAPALVEHALEMLGSSAAWHGISLAMLRGPELDELKSFAVALSEASEPSVEVRIRHREASAEVVDKVLLVAPGADAGRLLDWLGNSGALVDGDLESSLEFTATSGKSARSATLHIPVRGAQQVAERALESLVPSTSQLAFAAWKSVGSVAFVSQQSPSGHFGLRLSDERADAGSAHVRKAPAQTVPPVEQMVAQYEAHPLSLHPFFQRMGRHTVDVSHLWLMFSNVYTGLSQHFPRRLAWVVFGVEDERIRSVLTEQLHEELGAGDYTRTHRRLFLKLLDALAPWKPASTDARATQPGLQLSENLEAAYFDPEPYAGVGAAIVIELLGKQVDQFVADQFRRQEAVGMASLEWLTLHETLEVDHASESLDLASWVERQEDRVAAWRGGRAVHRAGWRFLDDMYRLCFAT